MTTKPQHKQLQPHNRSGDALTASTLKLHQRTVRLPDHRGTFTVVTLRPGVEAAWSTDYRLGTHRIISDEAGSELLARLLWGLSFVQTPLTVVALWGKHIRPTPFDADLSLPLLLLPAHQTPFDDKAFRALKTHLPRMGAPEKTICWRTFGLDAALQANKERQALLHSGVKQFDEQNPDRWLDWGENRQQWTREKISVCGGFLCYAAPPAVLRYQAQVVQYLQFNFAEKPPRTMDYEYIAVNERGGWCREGMVHIFHDYRRWLSDARVARREVCEADPTLSDPQTIRERVRVRREVVAARRK